MNQQLFQQINEILEMLGHKEKQSKYNFFVMHLGRRFKNFEEISTEELIRLYDVACNFLNNREKCMWGSKTLPQIAKKDKWSKYYG